METVAGAVVSGATGMLGAALIRLLVQRGTRVLALCRPGSPRKGYIPQSPLVRVVEQDLGGLGALRGKLGEERYEAFFHFAWAGTGGASRNDARLQSGNIHDTLEAVLLAEHLGCTTFVGAGSQAEYGRCQAPLRPDTPVFPETAYGAAKLCAGSLSRILCAQRGLRQVWMRVLSVYGPGDGEGTMVLSTLRALLRGERPRFTPGEQLWDYLYCDDAARAFLAAALHGKDRAAYPLGSGVARPLREYIGLMRQAVPGQLPVGLGEIPYAQGQVMYLCADISALTADTGFTPQVSFAEGIAKTLCWCREHPASPA